MLRTYVSFRSLILLFGLVAVGLPIALVGQLGIVRNLNAINLDVARIRQGQLAAAAVLQLQVDEESAIRGYASRRRPSMLEPYENARPLMIERLDALQSYLPDDGQTGPEGRALADLREVHARWHAEVAEPVIAGAKLDDRRATIDKLLIDRFRSDILLIRHGLDTHYATAIEKRESTIKTATGTSVAAIALTAVEVLVFGILIMRMRYELDRERAVVETLQVAASARLVPPPHLRIGTAYRSATRGARVGGDVYDVYRIDDNRTLVLVADISGKGLTAAVDTTFVRFAIRALASELLSPDEIVHRFDQLYRDANSAPESFVSLFAGLHDRRDGSLTYTNAGHEACWIRHSAGVEMLAPTGTIIGLGLPYESARVALPPGDLLFLATDGVTEARDPDGRFVSTGELIHWITTADASDPQRFVDAMVAAVTRWSRGRVRDDLALLAVMPLP